MKRFGRLSPQALITGVVILFVVGPVLLSVVLSTVGDVSALAVIVDSSAEWIEGDTTDAVINGAGLEVVAGTGSGTYTRTHDPAGGEYRWDNSTVQASIPASTSVSMDVEVGGSTQSFVLSDGENTLDLNGRTGETARVTINLMADVFEATGFVETFLDDRGDPAYPQGLEWNGTHYIMCSGGTAVFVNNEFGGNVEDSGALAGMSSCVGVQERSGTVYAVDNVDGVVREYSASTWASTANHSVGSGTNGGDQHVTGIHYVSERDTWAVTERAIGTVWEYWDANWTLRDQYDLTAACGDYVEGVTAHNGSYWLANSVDTAGIAGNDGVCEADAQFQIVDTYNASNGNDPASSSDSQNSTLYLGDRAGTTAEAYEYDTTEATPRIDSYTIRGVLSGGISRLLDLGPIVVVVGIIMSALVWAGIR